MKKTIFALILIFFNGVLKANIKPLHKFSSVNFSEDLKVKSSFLLAAEKSEEEATWLDNLIRRMHEREREEAIEKEKKEAEKYKKEKENKPSKY